MKKEHKIIIGIGIVSLAMLFVLVFKQSEPVQGSIVDGQAYYSTTTVSGFAFGKTIKGATTTGASGTLGSVIIASSTVGTFALYDATTTNVNLRTGNKATSTITLASFGASSANGTYTFDTVFNTGLLLDAGTGFNGSFTVTYR